MSTVLLNGQGSWRWCNENYAVAAADNTAITNHTKTSYMILCANVFYYDPCNKATTACQLKLQYSKDGGAWTDVGAAAEVRPTLVPAAGFSQGGNCVVKVAAAPAFCSVGFVTKPTQCENTNLTSSFANAGETFTEFQVALSFAFGSNGSTYTFRGYNVTTGAALSLAVGATNPSITLAATVVQTAIVDDTLTLGESASGLAHLKSSESESVTLTEQYNALAKKSQALSDSLTLTDLIKTGVKVTVPDTLTLSEEYALRLGTFLSDTLTFSEQLLAIAGFDINATEEDDLTDWTDEDAGAFTQEVDSGQYATVPESITLSDQVDTIAGRVIAPTDSFTLTEQYDALVTFLVSESDSLTFSDLFEATIFAGVNASDSLTLADEVAILAALVVAVPDSATFSELYTALGRYLSATPDSLTLTDQFDATAALSSTTTDSLTLTDEFVAEVAAGVSASDTLTLSEQYDAIAGKFVEVSDSFTLSDQADAAASLVATINEPLDLSELLVALGASDGAAFDTLTFTEQIDFIHDQVTSVEESLTLSDQADVYGGYILEVAADTITFSDSVFTYQIAAIFDTLSLAETYDATATYFTDIYDTLVISDSGGAVNVLVSGSVFPVVDSVFLAHNQNAVYGDVLSFTDSMPLILQHHKIHLGIGTPVTQENILLDWTEENGNIFTEEADGALSFKDRVITAAFYESAVSVFSFLDNFYTQVYAMPCPPATGPCNTPVTGLPEEEKSYAFLTPLITDISISFIPYRINVVWNVPRPIPGQYVRMFYREVGSSDRFSTIIVDRDDGTLVTPAELKSNTSYEVLMRLETDTTYSDWIVDSVVAPALSANLSFTDEFIIS